MPDPIKTNDANVSASAPMIPTQDSPITADLQAPQQSPPQQPLQLEPSVTVPGTPGVAATSKNPHLHRFISAVIGALAGPDATSYSTDPTSGKLVNVPAAPSTTGEKVARIARNALIGLSAGSQVGPQKSGLAGALSGLGAGAAVVTGQMSAEDRAAKEQARKDFEAEQQMILHKSELARGNALLYSTYRHLHDQDIDRNEEYGVNSAIAKAFEDENMPVRRMTGDQLLQEFHKSPQQLLTEGRVLLVGERPSVHPDTGEPFVDPVTQQQKYDRMYAVVNGLTDGKIKLPSLSLIMSKSISPTVACPISLG